MPTKAAAKPGNENNTYLLTAEFHLHSIEAFWKYLNEKMYLHHDISSSSMDGKYFELKELFLYTYVQKIDD